ncbi:MAG: addiction module protein [bacterium]|nr:addiction module protein [bacterium]
MLTGSEDIINQAMNLPPDTRALLADRLLGSLAPSGRKDIDALWAAEAERRINEIENGEVDLIPGDEVFKELRKSIK